MSVTLTYEFRPNKVTAQILVTQLPDGYQITPTPIYLLNDQETWQVTWQIEGSTSAVFEEKGIVFTGLPSEGFVVTDPGKFEPNDPKRWIATCKHSVKAPAVAHYCICLNLDGVQLLTAVDPSIAVTPDPIPTPSPDRRKDREAGLAAQRVEER